MADERTSSPANPSVASFGSLPKGSALSARITNVLSASFSDLEIKEALQILDQRGFENTAEARRNLQLDLQQELIQCNGVIVDDFGEVAEQLRRVGDALERLNRSCATVRAQIDIANRNTGPAMKEATSLLNQRTAVAQQQALLAAFKNHFLISEQDIESLTSNTAPVNDDFFRAVAKVKLINRDSQHLLGIENETLGLDILEQSSKQLNVGYQKLYRWIQREFKTLDLENPQIGGAMRRAIRVLAERPQLYQSWMDSFAESREQILSEAFQAALVGSATGSGSRPIEFQAHDPLRYVGDMLAWAHSATVSEREALEILFISEGDELARGIKEGIESDPFSRQDDADAPFDGKKALSDLISRDIAGVGRLLRQKTEQVVSSHDDATTAYKIANLIGFYKTTFNKVLAPDAAIFDLLSKLEMFALKQFRVNMQDHVASIQPELSQRPSDASPPEFLEDAISNVKTLLQAWDTSTATSDSQESIEVILSEALDPFLGACQALSKQMGPPEDHIFTINCLQASRTALAPFRFTKHRLDAMDDIVGKQIVLLKDYQYQFFLDSSGLWPLIEAISDLEDTDESIAQISSLPAFEEERLTLASQILDDFLPSALIDANDNLKKLRNTRLVREITEAAAERFCGAFEELEGKMARADEWREHEKGDIEDVDAEDRKPFLRELLPRTTEEIRVLLS